MGKFIPRGAPAKYAHHGVIEKQPGNSTRISCSKCKYYEEKYKTCAKTKLYLPEEGYGFWKYCDHFKLIEQLNHYKNRLYVENAKRRVQENARKVQVQVFVPTTLTLKNLVTRKIVVFEVDDRKTGKNILHPSNALVIKARQAPTNRAFHWQGQNYKVIENPKEKSNHLL